MVVGARASTLWGLGRRFLPEVIEPFDELRASLAIARSRGADRIDAESASEAALLDRAYHSLPPADFSRRLPGARRRLDAGLPARRSVVERLGTAEARDAEHEELGLQAPAPLARAL